VAPGVGFEPTRPEWATGYLAYFLVAPGLSSFLWSAPYRISRRVALGDPGSSLFIVEVVRLFKLFDFYRQSFGYVPLGINTLSVFTTIP